MPISNLNNVHLTDAQKKAILDAVAQLEAALEPLTVALTPEERQQYGSVNELHKLLINKVRDYHQNSAALASPDTNWEEFEKDHASRAFLEAILHRLEACGEKLANAKILHDYDNYQAALDDYAYTAYKAGSNKPGYETKRNELKQFFSSKRNPDGTFAKPEEPEK